VDGRGNRSERSWLGRHLRPKRHRPATEFNLFAHRPPECMVCGDRGAEGMIGKDVIHSGPEILGGTAAFVGTRVPVR